MNGAGRVPALTVDRLVVTGAAFTPERAERLRAQVELEVRRRLLREGLPGDLHDASVLAIQAPEVTLVEPERDAIAAAAIAERILRALGGPR
jgi:hypothetical protein